jgi:transposase
MRHPKHQMTSGEGLFVGIDLHKPRWHVAIRTFDVEVFSASIPGTWESLHRVLACYPDHLLQAVYEAGYFRFRLYDRLMDHSIPCLVTLPSLVPKEYGNRVKTDRRDSSKLAHLLAKGMLKRV